MRGGRVMDDGSSSPVVRPCALAALLPRPCERSGPGVRAQANAVVGHAAYRAAERGDQADDQQRRGGRVQPEDGRLLAPAWYSAPCTDSQTPPKAPSTTTARNTESSGVLGANLRRAAGWSGPAGQRPAGGRSCRCCRRWWWCRMRGSWRLPRSTLCHKADSALWRKVKRWQPLPAGQPPQDRQPVPACAAERPVIRPSAHGRPARRRIAGLPAELVLPRSAQYRVVLSRSRVGSARALSRRARSAACWRPRYLVMQRQRSVSTVR